MHFIPTKAGFYKKVSQTSSRIVSCAYADSKQISENEYELQHDLYYRSRDLKTYVVKKGFIHDGASKAFLKHFGKYTNSAIVHDALYGSHLQSRKKADDLFFEMMEVSGVSWLRKYTYFSAVRALGSSAYTSKSQESIDFNRDYIQILGGN